MKKYSFLLVPTLITMINFVLSICVYEYFVEIYTNYTVSLVILYAVVTLFSLISFLIVPKWTSYGPLILGFIFLKWIIEIIILNF